MRFFFIPVLILLGFQLWGQQLPPNVRWKEMQTPQLRIIYPDYLEKYAMKTARFVDSLSPSLTYPFGQPKRIPLILNPYTSVSNGYVRLAPRKSEWYLQPYHKLYFGNVPWYKDLATHEYRHVVQFNAMNDGMIKVFHFFMGDLGQLLGSFWAFPMWYFEGDAIDRETALSNGGRGRSHAFKMPMLMMASEYSKKNLDYYRIYYGSYKHYYPSHYHLGYFLTDYVNRKFSRKIWSEIISSATWTAFIPGSMNLWLKRKTGLDYKKLNDSVFAELKRYSFNHSSGGTNVPVKRPKVYTHDLFPVKVSTDSLFFLRYGFDELPTVYLYRKRLNRAQKIIHIPDRFYTANRNYIAWKEYKFHPRWHNQIYSRIRIYELKTGKRFYLTNIGKYQSPALSEEGNLLAVVRYDLNLTPTIEIWDVKEKKFLKSFPFKQFESVRQPSFANQNSEVVFTALTDRKDISGSTAVYSLHIQSGKIKKLTRDFIFKNINYPIVRNNLLYYQFDAQTVQATSEKNGILHLPVSNTYGMESFYIKNDTVYWSEYTSNGFRLRLKKIDFKTKQSNRIKSTPYRDSVPDTLYYERTSTYTIKKYNRLKDYFKPHSWIWGIAPASDSTWMASGGLMMNDLLDENAIFLGFLYSSPKDYTFLLNWEYKRFFPIIGVSYNIIDLRSTGDLASQFKFYVRVPLIYNRNIWSRGVHLQASFDRELVQTNIYYPFHAEFNWYVFKFKAYRNVSSRLGVSMYLRYDAEYSTVSENYTWLNLIRIPGAGKNDALTLKTTLGIKTGNYLFNPSNIPVRGTGIFPYRKIMGLQTEYHAPLFYPDWGYKPLFNLKRIRYKLFYDIARTELLNWQSTGLQIIGDWNFFGLKADFPLGIQIAYVQPLNRWTFSPVILNVSW